MNRSLQVSCLIATLLTQVNVARADGSDVVNIPAGEDKIVPMRKGEASPIDGQLFDNDTALRWANWLVQYKNLLKQNVELQRKLCAIDVNLANQKLEIEQERSKKVIPDLEEKLAKAKDEAANPPFYKTFWFGATMGATITAIGVIGVASLTR
jgi:hypothetical protein